MLQRMPIDTSPAATHADPSPSRARVKNENSAAQPMFARAAVIGLAGFA